MPVKRVILFSDIKNNENLTDIISQIFPVEIEKKTMGFMPAGGLNACKPKYIEFWQNSCKENNTNFILIDNSAFLGSSEANYRELQKFEDINLLVISGGDTIQLLHNLRLSGIDLAIELFTKKKEFVLAGYSAGAMIMTPSIKLVTVIHDKPVNRPIEEFTGLNLVNFEICPHYTESSVHLINIYKKECQNELKLLSDNDSVIINLE